MSRIVVSEKLLWTQNDDCVQEAQGQTRNKQHKADSQCTLHEWNKEQALDAQVRK